MVVETKLYTILDVLPSATEDLILKSYRNLARIYHPDRNPDGVEKFQEIAEAYKVLSDPVLRSIYNEKGEIGLRVQKSTESGCCQVYEDPNSGQLRSFCFGSMCRTFHSHSNDDELSDYSETDDEDDYEDEKEDVEENKDATFQNPSVSDKQPESNKKGNLERLQKKNCIFYDFRQITRNKNPSYTKNIHGNSETDIDARNEIEQSKEPPKKQDLKRNLVDLKVPVRRKKSRWDN